ncbi:MAG: hypothetical protein ACTSQJ_10870 [Promethearchaeota archaeon]
MVIIRTKLKIKTDGNGQEFVRVKEIQETIELIKNVFGKMIPEDLILGAYDIEKGISKCAIKYEKKLIKIIKKNYRFGNKKINELIVNYKREKKGKTIPWKLLQILLQLEEEKDLDNAINHLYGY